MTELHWVPAATNGEGVDEARKVFRDIYQTEATGVWSAPGRVNIIGEHIDYNGGTCLPIALPHRAYIAVRPRSDRQIRLVSTQTRNSIDELHLDTIGEKGSVNEVKGWAAYLAGVAWALEKEGYGPLPGFDAALWSCVPPGAGLSSSAALECAMAVALDDIAGLQLAGSTDAPQDNGRKILANAARRAENEIAGANTGGLDQSSSLRCQSGHALALDCRDMSVRHIPFDLAADGLELLVIDTKAPHQLVDGQYAKRRQVCEESARTLGVNLLVEIDDLEKAMDSLNGNSEAQMRVRHVVSEIARANATIDLLGKGPLKGERLATVSALLNDSHDSLQKDYEVTCPELDLAVDVARCYGAHGARMTGGGFGGSAIALLDAGEGKYVAQKIAEAFADLGFREPEFLIATPGGPASRCPE